MKRNNPFSLTFGKQPNRLIYRHDSMEQIVGSFHSDNSISQAFLIEGIRGSGKTVLMTTVANRLEEEGWTVINLNSSMELLENLALRLGKACESLPDKLKKGFSVSAFGVGFGMGGSENTEDPVGVIEDCLKFLKKNKRRVLITVDEVRNDKSMRIFASQFQIFVREDYPVFLLMTGLYENIYAVQNDPALTFLLRTPKVRTDALSILQIKNQYKEVFAISEAEAQELAELTKGYAFAFQALGAVYWDDHERITREELLRKLDEMLDGFVYRKIWEGLSGKEREIVAAMDEKAVKVENVRQRTGISSASFSQYRSKLIAKGVLTVPQFGYVELALPRLSVIAKSYRISIGE